MHVNVQLRFNPAIGKQAPYYRLKESYRDVRGQVHSLIVLNVTTEAVNALGEKVTFRQCSKPSKQAENIYKALHIKQAPFKKIKICRTQHPPD